MNRKRLIIVSGILLLFAGILLWTENNPMKLPILGIKGSGEVQIEHQDQVALNQPFDVELKIDTAGNNCIK